MDAVTTHKKKIELIIEPTSKLKKLPKLKKIKKKKVKKVKRELPRYLTCILTGKIFKIGYVSLINQIKKLKFDTLEDYQNFYICKEARKLLSDGKTIEEIRNIFNCDITIEIPFKILKCFVKKVKTKGEIEKTRKREMVKKMLNAPREIISVPYSKQTTPYDLNNEQHISELTVDACIAQDIYLNSGKTCDECRFYKFCKCKLRKVSKYYYDK